MKSSGSNIEDTHMRDMDHIARLVPMVCMALVWRISLVNIKI